MNTSEIKRTGTARRKKNVWKYLIGLLLGVVYLFPFYVVLTVALKPKTDLSSRLVFPLQPFLGNFAKVINDGLVLTGFLNTIIITGLTMLVLVFSGSMAAYALSRNQSRLNEKVRGLIMAVMMVTPLCILVGIYSTMSAIGGMSTYWGIVLVLATFGLPIVVYLYSNFIASIPIALDEAAAIDGANSLQIFFRVVFPQLKHVTVTVIIVRGVSIWNEYAYCYYFLKKTEMQTITLAVKSYFSFNAIDYGSAAASAILGMLPLVVLYVALQKYFIQSTVDSAIKS